MDLTTLYRAVIMDHYKSPRNKGLIKQSPYHFVHLNNPSCGDDMHVSLRVEDGNILDIRHDGHGCSICCSSASVMSELLKGKSIDEATEIINDFYEMVKGNEIADEEEKHYTIVYKTDGEVFKEYSNVLVDIKTSLSYASVYSLS